MNSTEQLEKRLSALERQTLRYRAGLMALAMLLVVSLIMPRSQAQTPTDLRVRSLIIEDANGQARVVLGAPLPNDGRATNLRAGIRINDPKGLERMGLTLSEQSALVMGFDAPPGTGDDRNRERVTIVADEKGGAAIRLKDRRTSIVSSWYLDDQNRGWMEFSDYTKEPPIRRRLGLADESVTGAR